MLGFHIFNYPIIIYTKYTKTKKYAEEVAKDKLGLVYEGEIIFKEKD